MSKSHAKRLLCRLRWDFYLTVCFVNGVLTTGFVIEGEYEFVNFNSVTSLSNSSSNALAGDLFIDDSVTSVSPGSFAMCADLTSISVSEDNTGLASIDGALYSKDMTKLIAYPAGKTNSTFEAPASVTQMESFAFAGCKSLERISLPSAYIGDGIAFWECTSLEILEVATLNESWWYAEDNCSTYFDTLPVKALVIRVEPPYCGDPGFLEAFDHIYIPSKYMDEIYTDEDKYGTEWDYQGLSVRILEDYTVDGTATGALDLAKMGIE